VRDEVARASLGLDPRLFLELPDLAGELVPDEILGTLEQVLLRLVHRHPGDALQLGELDIARRLLLLLELTEVLLPVGKPLFSACELGELTVDLLLLRKDALLDLDDPPAMLRDLRLGLRPQPAQNRRTGVPNR